MRQWALAAMTAIALASMSCVSTRPAAASGGMQAMQQWAAEHLLSSAPRLPFSFVYDGKPSEEFLAAWPTISETKTLDKNRIQRTFAWTDWKTGLAVRCQSVEYADYPAVEWTVYFKNTGAKNTPILRDIQAMDARFECTGNGEFVLHGIKGDFCAADSFQPYQYELTTNAEKRFAPPAASGKSSDGPDGWPYFNLQMHNGGVIMAVGWPGQWASSFTRDASTGLRVKAGQQLTNLYLKPGEEIRTPLIAMLFWQGKDFVSAQNLWRRWYIEHNLPRVDGRTQTPLAQIQVGGSEQTIEYVKEFLKAGIKPDICWRDAGAGADTWYPSGTGPYKDKDAWLNTGTWAVDSQKFPRGFKPFSDWIHAHGMKFVLWFEPERVGDPNSWLGKNHPEWLLPGTSHGSLLNEGDPAARQWLIDHIDGMIKSQGIDWYREDMNGGGPLPAWRKHDVEDRQGITENLYVQGHLAFWDELRHRHPNLRIDSCASGGRRNDLETMRRAVPLLRSDFQFPEMPGVVEGNQGHTYGLSFWLPFQGSGVYAYEPYCYRSFYMASFGMGHLTLENTAAQRKAYAECRKVAPMMLGDYFPLTPYSLDHDRWIAWQFNRPDQGDGVVQAFRRAGCQSGSMVFQLNGLDPAACYEVTDFDASGPRIATGKVLMETGLSVEIKDKPGAGVVVYRKTGQAAGWCAPAAAVQGTISR